MQIQTILPEPRMTPLEPAVRCEFCDLPLHPDDYRTWRDFAVCDECYAEKRDEDIQQLSLQKFMDLLEETVNPVALRFDFEEGELYLTMITNYKRNAEEGKRLLKLRDVSYVEVTNGYDGKAWLTWRMRIRGHRFEID